MIVTIIALAFLIVSFVLAAIRNEWSAGNFALWAIAVAVILPSVMKLGG